MASGISGMRLGAAAAAAASQSAEPKDPPVGRIKRAWSILRMLYQNDFTRYSNLTMPFCVHFDFCVGHTV